MSFINGDYRDYKKGMMHDRFANEECDECGYSLCQCNKSKPKKKIYSDGRGGLYEVEEEQRPVFWKESVYG